MTAQAAPELPPIGSRWYIAGHHWRIEAHTIRDGEPGVTCINLKSGKRFTWIWRLAGRRALPSGIEE